MASNSGVSQTQPYTQQLPAATGPLNTSRIIDGNNLGISAGPTIRDPNTSSPLVSIGFDDTSHLAQFNAAQRRQQQALLDASLESNDPFDTRTDKQIARSNAAALKRAEQGKELNKYLTSKKPKVFKSIGIKRGGTKRYKKGQTKRHKRQTKRHKKRQTKRQRYKK
jgi:hypothetical protein